MKRITYTFKRRNEKGRMTIRYIWEFLVQENRNIVLMVERYGYLGESCCAWAIQRSEIAEKFGERLASKLEGPISDAEMSRSYDEFDGNVTTPKQLVHTWRQKNHNGLNEMVDKAMLRFDSAGSAAYLNVNDIDDQFDMTDQLVSRYVIAPAPIKPVVVPPEVLIESRADNWGAW